MKELTEERNRIARTSAQQQQQIDKYKKLADDAKGKVDSLETQLSSTRKVMAMVKYLIHGVYDNRKGCGPKFRENSLSCIHTR